MELLAEYVLLDARRSGADFASYNLWLQKIARAMGTGGSAPASDDPETVGATAELEPFRRPNPQTHDLLLLQAIAEQTNLGKLGPLIVRLFVQRSDATRKFAAEFLLANYLLPTPHAG
jgi:hypothetical protein